MAINKFVDRQGNTLLDLSADTVSPNKVLAGTTYHGPDGSKQMGTLDPGPLDYSQYNFIDYDGTLLYSYTDEELDALTALPAGPDHTGDNLTFQSWNWTLANLKAWDRTRPDRPIVGANLITTDGKSYLYLDTPYTGATLKFSADGTINSVDWGDGTVDTNTSHVYANPGQYVIVIDMDSNGYWFIGDYLANESTNKQWITRIKLGENVINRYSAFRGCYSLESISIPNGATVIATQAFEYCYNLKGISIPNGVTSMGSSVFNYCTSLENISIPNGVTSISGNVFYACHSLKNISIPNGLTTMETSLFAYCGSLKTISIPDSVTTIKDYVFQYCYSLNSISIPDSVTSIGYNAFYYCYPLTLDISKQTKVIELKSSINLNSTYNKILVKSNLLENYKSAPQWSNYASSMVGV